MTATVDPAALLAQRLGHRLQRDVPLGPRTTYRVGGAARYAVEVNSEADLLRVASALAGLPLATLAVGNGSNLLVSDDGFDGLAILLGEGLAGIELGPTSALVGGAASLPVVARRTARAGLSGFEWAVGVPGSVGGGVRMNAGGHGSDMAACVQRVGLVDLRTATALPWGPAELAFGYRHSAVASHHIVVWAELRLTIGSAAGSLALIDEIVAWRRANQPGGANAGSVFTNPAGDSAGRLIDAAGGKGMRVGTAAVSTKHANFIQTDPGGRALDVWLLMQQVRRLVRDRGGPDLVAETHLVGFGPEPGSSPA